MPRQNAGPPGFAPPRQENWTGASFLYRNVLDRELGELDGLIRARRRSRLPVVLTREEVKSLFAHLDGAEHLFFSLLYGTGMRLSEGLRLRVKDVDFSTREITVRDGKGGKDRVTVLPESVKALLLTHLREVRQLHQRDLESGGGRVHLPYALARKYPRADQEWGWQYVFPAPDLSRDPRMRIPLKATTRSDGRRPLGRSEATGEARYGLGGRLRLPPCFLL